MKRLFPWLACLLLAVAVPRCLGADGPDPLTRTINAADASGPNGRKFQILSRGLSVEGTVRYDREIQRTTVKGIYRSRQNLGADSKLSYQLRDLAGRVLLADGERFEWHAEPDWPQVANFEFRLSVLQDIPDLSALKIEFNYVEEGRFWYRDRFPTMAIPTVAILDIPARQQFRRVLSHIPVIVPAGTRCLLPVLWRVMNETNAARHYQGSVEVIDVRTDRMVDAPRLAAVPAGSAGSNLWQWQSFTLPAPGYYQIRPSFVWNEVRWYSGYVRNPFVTVLAVSPVLYATSVALVGLLAAFVWIGSSRLARPGQLAMRALLVLALLLLAHVTLTPGYLALVGLMVLTCCIAGRMTLAGEQAYVVLLGAVLIVEVYWGLLCGPQPYGAGALVFSFCVAAILLFPLTRVSRPVLARGLAVALVVVGLAVTTVLVMYYQFFRDFPSVGDLAYASQAGELGDSILELIGPQFAVPPMAVLPLLLILWRRPVQPGGAQ